MSLLSSLHTASTALEVFSTALGADQTNVSNSSTPGFAAVRATISPIGPSLSGLASPDSVEIQSTGNFGLDVLAQAASSQSSYSRTTADQLGPANQLFDITGGSGILAALQQFGAAFSSLAVAPNDTSQRSAALASIANVAASFHKAVTNLDAQKSAIDANIQDTVTSINRLAVQIRQYNLASRSKTEVDPSTDASLRSALDQLSSLTDITTLKNGDGTVTVLTGGQLPLVVGDQAYTLNADLSHSPEAQISSSAGGNSPASFSGRLGALLNLRSGPIANLIGSPGGAPGLLNDLAKGFASQVNSLLTSGVTPAGNPGSAVFTYDNSVDINVARTLALDSGVTSDALGLATTGTNATTNGIATRLASLPQSAQASDQINGFSPAGLFAFIAAGIGQQLADARNAAATDATGLTFAQSERQKVSGVSLDEEAVSITSYQRAYEASAKVVSILDQLTADEVNIIK